MTPRWLHLGLMIWMCAASPAAAQEEDSAPEDPPVSQRDQPRQGEDVEGTDAPEGASDEDANADADVDASGDADADANADADADAEPNTEAELEAETDADEDEDAEDPEADEHPEDEPPPPEEAPPPTETDPAEADEPFEWPQRLGPFQIDTGVGRLRFGLGVQLKLKADSIDNGDGTRDDRVAAEIRRLRTTLSGRFLDDRLSFAFQLNSVPGAFELIDMWIDGEILPDLRVRIGQFKIPFTRYRLQSFSRMLLADWSDATFYYGSERQLGLTVHDGPADPTWDYSVGVFTGENRRAAHGVGVSELYGEPRTGQSGSDDGRGDVDDFHPEIVGLVGHGSEDFSTAWLSDSKGGPLRYLITLSGTLDFDPEVARDWFARIAPEAQIKIGGLSFIGTGYIGFVRTAQDDEAILGSAGFNLEVAYRPFRLFEVALRYFRLDVLDALSNDARARADDIIASATTPEEMNDLIAQYADVGLLEASNELTLGVNVFIIGHSLEWQTDGTWQRSARRDGARDDFRARTQIQLAF